MRRNIVCLFFNSVVRKTVTSSEEGTEGVMIAVHEFVTTEVLVNNSNADNGSIPLAARREEVLF